MSADLRKKSDLEEKLDDIYSDLVDLEYEHNTRKMAADNASFYSNYNNKEEHWTDIENRKRSKFKYYYENYSFKKLIISVIIT